MWDCKLKNRFPTGHFLFTCSVVQRSLLYDVAYRLAQVHSVRQTDGQTDRRHYHANSRSYFARVVIRSVHV